MHKVIGEINAILHIGKTTVRFRNVYHQNQGTDILKCYTNHDVKIIERKIV